MLMCSHMWVQAMLTFSDLWLLGMFRRSVIFVQTMLKCSNMLI